MTTDTIEIIKNPTEKQLETLEIARDHWKTIAIKYGWHKEPFYVQVWIHDDGKLDDAVSFQGLDQDIMLPAREIDEEDW